MTCAPDFERGGPKDPWWFLHFNHVSWQDYHSRCISWWNGHRQPPMLVYWSVLEAILEGYSSPIWNRSMFYRVDCAPYPLQHHPQHSDLSNSRWESGQVRETPGRWRESTFPLLEMSVAPELTGFEDEVIEMFELKRKVGKMLEVAVIIILIILYLKLLWICDLSCLSLFLREANFWYFILCCEIVINIIDVRYWVLYWV